MLQLQHLTERHSPFPPGPDYLTVTRSPSPTSPPLIIFFRMCACPEVLSILGALSDSAHSRFTKWFVSKLTQLEVLASRRVKLTAELVTKRAKKGQVERGKKDLSEARLDRDNTSGGTGTTPYNVHKSAGTGRRIGVGTFNIGPRCGGTGYRARTRQQSEVVLQRSRVGEVVCTEGGIVTSGTRPLSPIAAPTPGSPTVSAGFAPAGSSGVLCLGGRETGSGSSATSGGSGDGVGEGARDVGLRGESRGPDIGSDGNGNSTRSNGVDGTSASIGSGPDSKCSFVFGSSAGDVPSSPFSCDRVSIASTGISAGSSSNGFTFGTAGHTGGRRGLVLVRDDGVIGVSGRKLTHVSLACCWPVDYCP